MHRSSVNDGILVDVNACIIVIERKHIAEKTNGSQGVITL